MPDNPPTVYIVDDDPDMRESLEFLLQSLGIVTKAHASAGAFLAEFQTGSAGCLVCDVRMPDMSGLDLFEHLSAAGSQLPVILMTAYADVPMAIRALQAGAAEFIEKPFNAHQMLERIQRALAQDGERRAALSAWEEFGNGMAELTDKERETLEMLMDGAAHKVIAARLDISERAVEMRRASVMKKLHVNSLAELIRRVTQYELLFPKRRTPSAFRSE
ncbi:MAG: response regulator transcription factor [Planctomycetes bacterium]|nr:response regulator transcription factor [Planctomycetota bacterium]